MSKRYAFLFDKCLLLCKTRGEAYDIKEKLDLKKFRVDSEIASSGKGKVTKYLYILQIIHFFHVTFVKIYDNTVGFEIILSNGINLTMCLFADAT